MAPSRRTVLATGAAGLITAAASANAQTRGQGSPPQPMRPGRGGTDPGPRNLPIEMQNPDIFVPPPTDHGTVANLKFPFSALAHAARARRLDPPGHRARARHLQGDRRRQHAAQGRRRARAALAQGGRVGLHAQGPRADHRRRRGGPPVPGRRRRRRPVELPVRHPALDPGAGGRRLRVPAGLRRRQLQRGQHLLAHRLVRTCRPRCWPRTSACRRRLRQHPRRASSTSSRRRCPARSPRTGSPAPGRCPARSATGCWRRSRSAPRAARSASPTPPTSRPPTRSPPRSSRSSRAACASCTGIRTRTSGSTTSPARAA